MPRIMLIEQDPVVRALTTTILYQAGYTTIATGNDTVGLRTLETDSVALVLTDGFGGNLTEIATRSAPIRAAARSAPVVLFTTHVLERETARAVDFHDLISKPFDLVECESHMRALMCADERRC